MNKVMLIGNVGREPEVRYVDQGVAVARLTMATTERGYVLQSAQTGIMLFCGGGLPRL